MEDRVSWVAITHSGWPLEAKVFRRKDKSHKTWILNCKWFPAEFLFTLNANIWEMSDFGENVESAFCRLWNFQEKMSLGLLYPKSLVIKIQTILNFESKIISRQMSVQVNQPWVNVGFPLWTNVGCQPWTNIGCQPRINVGYQPWTNIDSQPWTNIDC